MSITSLSFFAFFIVSLIIYYLTPSKFKWINLLIYSLTFFFALCSFKLFLYLLYGVIVSYIGTRLMAEKYKQNKKKIFILTLILIVSELFVLKYINIVPLLSNTFSRLFNFDFNLKTISILAPLGISYYTLSLIGYIIDVYRGSIEPQKNIFKHALFTCYFPSMISGPILRYSSMKEELFKAHAYNWKNILFGFERILFGLLKKLVIADRLAIIVKTIFSDYTSYSGLYIIFGVMCYALQIYTDFTGCMDIVLGVSESYDIKLPENFNSPLFSKKISEFWRRWHITLGLWAKDYILYPLLKSNNFQELNTKCKKIFGKKIGKKIPVFLATFILWILIGIWHGPTYKYIFAAGILPCIYLLFSEIIDDIIKSNGLLNRIDKETFSFKLFQILRTLSLMCFLWLFVCSPSLLESINVMKAIFKGTNIQLLSKIGITSNEYRILFGSLLLCFIVEYMNYKEINIREWFSKQILIFRWIILYIIIFTIILFGVYGAGYNPTDFIYGGF